MRKSRALPVSIIGGALLLSVGCKSTSDTPVKDPATQPKPTAPLTNPMDTKDKPGDLTAKLEDTTATPGDPTAKPGDPTAKVEDTTAKPEDPTPKLPALSGTTIRVQVLLSTTFPHDESNRVFITVTPPPEGQVSSWPKGGGDNFEDMQWAVSPLIRAALAEAGYHDDTYLNPTEIAAINAEWTRRIPYFFVMARELFATALKQGDIPEGGNFRGNIVMLRGYEDLTFDETTHELIRAQKNTGEEPGVFTVIAPYFNCQYWAAFTDGYTGDKTDGFYKGNSNGCEVEAALPVGEDPNPNPHPLKTLRAVIRGIMDRP